jgi:hypothetical protein
MSSEIRAYDEYDDTYRNIEAEAGVQAAFMIGQLFQNPTLLFEAQIAHKEQEILDATKEGASSEMICALHFELKYLKLVQIEAQGVYQNAHSEAIEE